MADSNNDIAKETALLDRAIWRKWNKFTWSALLLILLGLVLIASGLALRMEPYSVAGLLIGIGAIVVIVGIIRWLIGLINPMTPEDLRSIEPEDAEPDRFEE